MPLNQKFPFLGFINFLENDYGSDYHGLQVTLNFSTSGPIPVDKVLQMPEFGTFGNAGRNIFRGPHFRNWDLSLVKTWRVTERVNVQLRSEFFNVLNHPNFANPAILFNNDLGFLDTFGLSGATPDVAGANPVIGTGGPRNIQFGLKVRF